MNYKGIKINKQGIPSYYDSNRSIVGGRFTYTSMLEHVKEIWSH